MEPRRVLIVANQTAAGEHLKREVQRRIAEGPCRFTVLVPATPPQEHVVWTEGEAHALAERRMTEAMAGLRQIGAEVEGVVGDPRPVEAIADLLLTQGFDEIVLSTFPSGASRWLKQDLPHRVERRFGLPVTHVIGEQAPAEKP